MATKPPALKKADPKPETEAPDTDAPEAPLTTSIDGHALLRLLKDATAPDAALIADAESYLATFALSAPGTRLAANVAKELKRVKGLK